MSLPIDILTASWHLLLDAAPYILFGIVVAGLLKVFLSPASIARHLGQGRISSVVKAALLGIPLPLCSCGVLPAAAALKRQGANNGATTAFLISTPESGVDSIVISYALLDPLMTVARPLAALITALMAGLSENLLHPPEPRLLMRMADLSCTVDGCCDGRDCPPEEHARHHSLTEKLAVGMRYAFTELWGDLAGWFLVGLVLAGIISALVPEHLITTYLGGGLSSMLLMLAIGIPLYICASASTPIAAALILKGVSPGTALVFLLAGPATNLAAITVLTNLLGRRAILLYLSAIAIGSVVCGLILDWIYITLAIQPQAVLGQAGELLPEPVRLGSALTVLALSVGPVSRIVRDWLRPKGPHSGCGCDGSCSGAPVDFPKNEN
ncbi:MAG: SO_0444 family Cu/Zn efflux transporter [Thermodesulfobacteriota bacterium]